MDEKQSINIKDFSEEVQVEIQTLQAIESFLKRTDGIKGEESFLYVAARKYLVERCQKLAQSEVARLAAAKTVKKLEVVPPAPPESPPDSAK